MINKNILLFSVFLYVIGFTIAFYIDFYIFEIEIEKVNQFLITVKSENKFHLWMRIIKNNIFVLFFNILGSFSFGLLTIITTLYNGFILGYLIKSLIDSHSQYLIVYHLLPHVIEILAYLLSAYLGLKYGINIYRMLFHNNKILTDKSDYFVLLSCFIIIFISSLLEAYVSTC